MVPPTVIPPARLAGIDRQWLPQAVLGLIPGWRWRTPLLSVLVGLKQAPVYLLPLLCGVILDRLRDDPAAALASIPWILGAAFGLCVLNVATTLGFLGLLSATRRSLTAALRVALLRRLHRVSIERSERQRSGELLNSFVLDQQRIDAYLGFLFDVFVCHGIAIVVMLAVMAWKDWRLLILLGLAVPANVLLWRALWSRIKDRAERFRIAESGFLGFVGEALSGLRLTRAHGVEEFAERRISVAAGAVAEQGRRMDLLHALFASLSWTSGQFLHMSIYVIGVWCCVRGWISLGDLVVLATYFTLINGSLSAIVGGLPQAAAASDSLRSVAELFSPEAGEEDDAGKPALGRMRGELELQQVSFSYASGSDVLSGIDLHIPAGSSLALVGPSGSGKSTIAALLIGIHVPRSGRVLVDGQDLAGLDRRSLRRQVGMVQQDPVLFADSVFANITWGDERPDRERAIAAAVRAQADQFITAMPEGYDTVLGDRGTGLSGGQRQRLAIARAIYRDPRLLLLDEATSALDQESERLVQIALRELMRDRTTVIIAHRLATVRHADRIAVLDKGQIVESGTWDGLTADPRSRLSSMAGGSAA